MKKGTEKDKAEKAPKEEAPVAVVDKVFVDIQKKITTKIAKSKKFVKITDKASFEAANKMAAELKEEINEVTALHKSGKDPFLKICQQFDGKKTILIAPITEEFNRVKNIMLVFQEAEEKKAKEESDKIEAERKKKEKEAADKQDKVNKMSEALQIHLKTSLKQIHQATSRKDLKIVYDRDVVVFRTNIPKDFDLLQDAAGDAVKVIVKLGQLKDKALLKTEGAQEAYDEEITKYLGKDSVAMQNIQEAAVSITEEIQEVASVQDTRLALKQSGVGTGLGKGLKITIDFDHELSKWEDVPEEWKVLNVPVIEKYIKENKDKLKDGQIVNGVKFTMTKKAGLKR